MDAERKFSIDDVVAVWKEIIDFRVGEPLVKNTPGPNEIEKWTSGIPWVLITPPLIEVKAFFEVINHVAGVVQELHPALAEEVKTGLASLPTTRQKRKTFLNRVLAKVMHKNGSKKGPVVASEDTAEMVEFLTGAAVNLVLRDYAREAAAWFSDERWLRGICPVCGCHPCFSELAGESRARNLHCGVCGTRWRFSRIGCPFCEAHIEEQKLFILEGSSKYRVYVCDNCKSYLKTVDTQLAQPEDLLLENIKTLFLDQLLINEGYGHRSVPNDSVKAVEGGTAPSGP
ncbi:MAG: formate dehydrogenase accessory protein FdhE [Ammonifex sp.]|jgi:FdhE protein|nr:MAG: formate dehydrogenase accessory protein FdhE [Ammonifex sp.]